MLPPLLLPRVLLLHFARGNYAFWHGTSSSFRNSGVW
jgi:hypothetical protein